MVSAASRRPVRGPIALPWRTAVVFAGLAALALYARGARPVGAAERPPAVVVDVPATGDPAARPAAEAAGKRTTGDAAPGAGAPIAPAAEPAAVHVVPSGFGSR